MAGIQYLDGRRIRRGMRAGALRVIAAQEHLNKINVYPVPDGDTGTNLALTMGSVYSAVGSKRSHRAGETFMHIADAALDGARGNSGAIVAQFFQGVSDSVADLARLSVAQFSDAVRSGEQYARDALVKPVEGTVLTVMRDFADAVHNAVSREPNTDFVGLLREGLGKAKESLAQTPGKLDVLRAAGVVDAGAEGFVRLINGICDYIATGDLETTVDAPTLAVSDEHRAGEEVDLDYRFCTECMITGENINRRALKEELMVLGGSLVLAGTHSKTRVHIHVNDPQRVFELAAQFGDVTANKADDMQRQQSETHAPAQRTVIMMDSAGDIPDADLERLGVHMTPVRLHFGNESYLDKVSITADEFYARLATSEHAPKTSQPAPGDFRREFQFLASHYESVVCINVTGAASGTYQAAVSAAERSGAPERVHVFDSWSVSVGQGLMALHAAEMARANRTAHDIMTELQAIRTRTPIYALIRDLEAAVRGGRVKRSLKRVVDTLRLTPVLGIKGEGELTSVGMLRGRKGVLEKFTRFVEDKAQAKKHYRLAVGHTNCESDARQLYDALLQNIENIESSYFCRVGSALGAHTGGDGIVVALQEYTPPESTRTA
ncbi:MAG: DegV family protein [Gammaproteobacteria bacterium]